MKCCSINRTTRNNQNSTRSQPECETFKINPIRIQVETKIINVNSTGTIMLLETILDSTNLHATYLYLENSVISLHTFYVF